MTLRIEPFTAGPIETNAYLVYDEATREGLVIDAPVDSAEAIVGAAEQAGVTIGLVYITHAHWDHIGDAAALKERTGGPLAAHRLCEAELRDPGSTIVPLPVEVLPVAIDRFVEDGDTVELGEHRLLVMHLPGHEPGHTALWDETEGVFLGGDVLFPNGHGRIDLPGSSAEQMGVSLTRLAGLPGHVRVYPGHGESTTIGEEPWLQMYLRERD
jgi:hydroxyacylglutathione hydrolase